MPFTRSRGGGQDLGRRGGKGGRRERGKLGGKKKEAHRREEETRGGKGVGGKRQEGDAYPCLPVTPSWSNS